MEVPVSDDERESSLHLPLKRKLQVHVSISFQIQCSFDYIIHPKSSVLRCTRTHKKIQTLQLYCGSAPRKFGLCWWHSEELHIFSPNPHERGPQNRSGDFDRKTVLSTSVPQQMQLSIESQRTPFEGRELCAVFVERTSQFCQVNLAMSYWLSWTSSRGLTPGASSLNRKCECIGGKQHKCNSSIAPVCWHF